MPGTAFYRAMATASFLREELMHQREAHDAMKLCFEKIHKSLDMYQGHYINRLRFHLNRHHTEYLRKVRAMRKERNEKQMEEERQTNLSRRSMRVGIAQDLANEVETLKLQLRRKELEIDRMAMLLDDKNTEPTAMQTAKQDTTPKPKSIEQMMNPYLPSSDDDDTTPNK